MNRGVASGWNGVPTPFLLENVPEKAEVQQIQIEFTGIAWSFSAREYVFYVFFFNFKKRGFMFISTEISKNVKCR